MSILNNSAVNSITHSTFVNQAKDTSTAFEVLKNAATPRAFHSFIGRPEPGRCYPNTRVDLLTALERWIGGPGICEDDSVDPADDMPTLEMRTGHQEMPDGPPFTSLRFPNLPIIWLTGGAGAGKSAVAQTFAERCEDLGHIVASFFFFSTDPTRNSANRLVATLAYQIARADPGVRAHIEAVVLQDPYIFDQDFKKQIVSLIINPVWRSTQVQDAEPRQRQCVIVIDGLDECTGGEVQAGIIRAISDALRAGSTDQQKALPYFLICGRPEEPIQRVFRSLNLQKVSTSINLSHDIHAHDDIRSFLKGMFAEIKQTHPRTDLIPASWPSDNTLSTLVSNSSGHFIYAETVVRHVSNNVRPVAALDNIVGLRALPQRVRESLAELDELYRHILLRALEKSGINTVRHVLGLVAFGGAEYHPDIIAKFYDLEDGALDTLLGTIPSLAFQAGEGRGKRIRFYHKSFSDFLLDKFRAAEFYIGYDGLWAYIWARSLDMASKSATIDEEIFQFVSNSVLRFHVSHDISAGTAMSGLESQDDLEGERIRQTMSEGIRVTSGLASLYDRLQTEKLLSQLEWQQFTNDSYYYTIDGTKSHSLLGMIQRRDFLAFINQFDGKNLDFKAKWTACCFNYWLQLSYHGRTSDQMSKQATAIMMDIIKDVLSLSSPTIPLLMARASDHHINYITDYFPLAPWWNGTFGKFFARYTSDRWPYSRDHSDFISANALERFLGDQEMGAYCLNGERFAKGCLFWMTYLTRNGGLFSHRTKRVLRNQYGRLLGKSAHQQRITFRWSRTKHPRKTNTRLYFHYIPQRFPTRELNEKISSNTWGYIKRKALFDADRPYAFFRKEQFSEGMEVDDVFEKEGARRQQFRFVLSRIPPMLAKASKSDAVAALRHRAFPPLARCFPELTRSVQQAIEEYAARHGYDSPYIDVGPRYTAGAAPQEESPSGNEFVIPTAAASGDVVAFCPPLVTSILACGQKRARPARFPPSGAHSPGVEICDDPGCETVITKEQRSLNCSSPDY
ncbi:hypothetical protein D9619_013615 [Psilocybe cf. subviscida]|uniref:Nephrocystin 3-like N-terminal domain-containing protein n=1 Tax=Psilocybe cf. subviscida TaxID=2480587 RepID=A0A8H5BRX4_9AGAR|nr:hypothetical protein D9619_013615 [Psilocybe cf. subviscida]